MNKHFQACGDIYQLVEMFRLLANRSQPQSQNCLWKLNSFHLWQLFPDSLEIRGRIPFHTVWDYFNKLKSAGSTELTVLRFHVAHEEDKGLYGNLFNYFSTRERIGVVGGFEKPLIKDFYILPLPSHKPVPENILPFEGPGKK